MNKFKIINYKYPNYILFGFIFLFAVCYILFAPQARARDEIDELTEQINELQRSLDMSRDATTPLEATLNNLEKQIASIQAKIAGKITKEKKPQISIKSKLTKNKIIIYN